MCEFVQGEESLRRLKPQAPDPILLSACRSKTVLMGTGLMELGLGPTAPAAGGTVLLVIA